MDFVDAMTDNDKQNLLDSWAQMVQRDRDYFLDQVALCMDIWGSDRIGRELVVRIMHYMSRDDAANLADFGLYVGLLSEEVPDEVKRKISKAEVVMENYRHKYGLSDEPRRKNSS